MIYFRYIRNNPDNLIVVIAIDDLGVHVGDMDFHVVSHAESPSNGCGVSVCLEAEA